MILSLAMAVVVPAPAPPSATPPLEIAPDEKAASERFFEAMQPRPLSDRLKTLDALLTNLVRPTPFRSVVICTRAKTLGSLGHPEFKDAAARCYLLLPTAPIALWMYAESRKYDADPKPAAKAFVAALGAAPQVASFLPPADFSNIVDQLDLIGEQELAGQLLDALDKAGFGAANARWSSWTALRSFDRAASNGSRTRALQRLPLITNPQDALLLLIDRRYRTFEPEVSAYARDGLVSQRDMYVAATRGAFEVEATAERRQDYASALVAAGKSSDAISLLKAGVIEGRGEEQKRLDVVLLAVRAAALLADVGRIAEAIVYLQQVDVDLRKAGFGSATQSIVPNLAHLYVLDRRGADAMALLDARSPARDQFPSDESYAIMPALRACALYSLGKKAEADAERRRASALGPNNEQARRMMMACFGDLSAAKEMVLKDLENGGRRMKLIVELRRAQLPPAQVETGWTAMLRTLAADPAVVAALDRHSMPVPERFVPAFRNWAESGAVSTLTKAED